MTEFASGRGEDELAQTLSEALKQRNASVAVAESLTGGQLAATLAAAPQASEWFRGGIVAYHPEVKYDLLDAPEGPVVTPETATAMARSVVRLTGADIGVALTGVGGPTPDEGEPAGTVFLAVCEKGLEPTVMHMVFAGEPLDVMRQTIDAALQALIVRVRTMTE